MKRILISAVALLAGCSQGDVVTPTEPVTQQSNELLGDSKFSGGCTEKDAEFQLTMHEYGRTAAVTTAFEQCIQAAVQNQGTVSWSLSDEQRPVGELSSSFGPYQSCAGEPFANASPQEQTRRALIASRNPNDVRIHCSGAIEGANASADIGQWGHGGEDEFHWGPWFRDVQKPRCSDEQTEDCIRPNDVWPFSQGAGTIWHEAMHTHGYSHDDCGRGDTPGWHFQRNTMPYIVGRCIETVLELSGASCDVNSCGSGELSLIDGLNSTSCECVTDPKYVDYSPVLVNVDYTGPYLRQTSTVFDSANAGGLAAPLIVGVDGRQTATLTVAEANLPAPRTVEWTVTRAGGGSTTTSGERLVTEYGLGDKITLTVESSAAYPAGMLPTLEYDFIVPHVTNPGALAAPGPLAQAPVVGSRIPTRYGADGLGHIDLRLDATSGCYSRWDWGCGMTIDIAGPQNDSRRFYDVPNGASKSWEIDWLPQGRYTWSATNTYERHSASAALDVDRSGKHFEVTPAEFADDQVPPAAPFGTGHYMHFDSAGRTDHVTLHAVSFDLNGDPVTLEFEVRRYDQTFTDTPTHTVAASQQPGAGAQSLHVSGEIGLTYDLSEYHWQVRASDGVLKSAWVYAGHYPDRADIVMIQMLNIDRGRVFDNPHLVREGMLRDFDVDIWQHDILRLADTVEDGGLYIRRRREPALTAVGADTISMLPVGTSGVATSVPSRTLNRILEQTRVVPAGTRTF